MEKPRPKRISDFKPVLTNLAQTSHYEVRFGRAAGGLSEYLSNRGVDKIVDVHCILQYMSHVRVVRAERGRRTNRGGRRSKSDPNSVPKPHREESPKNINK